MKKAVFYTVKENTGHNKRTGGKQVMVRAEEIININFLQEKINKTEPTNEETFQEYLKNILTNLNDEEITQLILLNIEPEEKIRLYNESLEQTHQDIEEQLKQYVADESLQKDIPIQVSDEIITKTYIYALILTIHLKNMDWIN